MRNYGAVALIGAAAMAGCAGPEPVPPPPTSMPGDGALLDVEVTFRRADGAAAAHVPVWIVETFDMDNGLIVSDVVAADGDGRVLLDGYYCTPVVVLADGGGAPIILQFLQDRYEVRLKPDGLTREQAVAAPVAELAGYRRPRRDEACARR